MKKLISFQTEICASEISDGGLTDEYRKAVEGSIKGSLSGSPMNDTRRATRLTTSP